MLKYFTSSIILVMLLSGYNLVAAETMSADAAISSMAKIMRGLNHYPGNEDKKVLKNILQNLPDNSHAHTLAAAIMHLEHTVASEDAPKLKAIIDDTSASKNEQALARIILNLNHKPGAEDKKHLEMMMH